MNHITTKDHNTTLGMYVDPEDGWKVKVTEDSSKWDKFQITGFAPPSPPKPQ